MNKKAAAFLKRNKLEIGEYAYSYPKYEINEKKKYLYGIFGVFLLVYLLSVVDILPIDISGLFVYIMFSLFVLYPIATRTDNPNELVLLTKEGILKADDRKEYVFIKYDEITKYGKDDKAMYLVSGRNHIALEESLYDNLFEMLIDVLEAKGKTFDKEKDYMVRDIEIVIEDNKLKIIEIEEEETETERITDELLSKYSHLTPGYLEEIIPMNSIIRGVSIKKEHLHIECEPLEVKSEHPENTTFGHVTAQDCIFVFENAKIVLFEKRDSSKMSDPYDQLTPSITLFEELLIDAIITDWRYGTNEVVFVFKSGLSNVKLTLKYDEVIIGWNKMK